MKTSTINKYKYYLLGIAFIFILWGVISLVFDDNQLIFPNFFSVIKETIVILKGDYVYECLFNTIERMIIGFIGSFLFALIIGFISGMNKKFKYFFAPFIVSLKTIPTASLVFLFLVISGAKNAPIYIVALICFPILYEAVVAGFENIDSSINDALNIEKGKELTKIIKIRLPLALPYIITGIASSLGLSFKIEIMAEVLMGSTSAGLGSAISYIQKANPTDMNGIFSYSLIAIAFSLVFSFICDRIIQKNM